MAFFSRTVAINGVRKMDQELEDGGIFLLKMGDVSASLCADGSKAAQRKQREGEGTAP